MSYGIFVIKNGILTRASNETKEVILNSKVKTYEFGDLKTIDDVFRVYCGPFLDSKLYYVDIPNSLEHSISFLIGLYLGNAYRYR